MQEIYAPGENKVRRIQSYIEAVRGRSRSIGDFCALILSELPDSDDGNAVVKVVKVKQPAFVGGGDDPDGFLASLDAEMESEFPRSRYVQIGFDENYFFVDLPRESIFPDEADAIKAAIPGFRRASENPVTHMSREEINDFDPLQKFYLYGEEAEAAQDAATILFDVHGLSAGDPLYATAFAPSGPSWERDEPF